MQAAGLSDADPGSLEVRIISVLFQSLDSLSGHHNLTEYVNGEAMPLL